MCARGTDVVTGYGPAVTTTRPRAGATEPGAAMRRALAGQRPRAGLLAVLAVLVAAAIAVGAEAGAAIAAVAAWDVATAAMIAYAWRGIATADPAGTRARAATADPGRAGVLVITVLSCAVALTIAVVLLVQLGASAPGDRVVTTLFVLGLVAVVTAWVLVHTAFAVHYAHLYYRDDGDLGGLEFLRTPEPDDFDFAYFAFMVGTAFGGGDVGVSDGGIRRVVLAHSVLSFAFNTAILALVLELVSGAFS